MKSVVLVLTGQGISREMNVRLRKKRGKKHALLKRVKCIVNRERRKGKGGQKPKIESRNEKEWVEKVRRGERERERVHELQCRKVRKKPSTLE